MRRLTRAEAIEATRERAREIRAEGEARSRAEAGRRTDAPDIPPGPGPEALRVHPPDGAIGPRGEGPPSPPGE